MTYYRMFRSYLEKKRLWELFIYLFFGGLTTVVNIVVFWIANTQLTLSWQLSNSISWLLSVLFAFVTNKLWVFHSKAANWGGLVLEFAKFIVARIISFGMDMLVMFLLIDLIHTNDLVAKVVTQVIVVIANYFFSKWFVFQKLAGEEISKELEK